MSRLFEDAVPARGRTALTAVAEQAVATTELTDALVSGFGTEVIQKSASLSDAVLAECQKSDGGEFGRKMGQLAALAKGCDPKKFAQADGILSWIRGGLSSAKERLMQSFQTFTQQVDGLTTELRHHADLHRDRRALLQKLFDENADLYRSLEVIITKGGVLLQAERDRVAAAPPATDGIDAQVQAERISQLGRFEKRLHDLDIARTLSLQTGMQIRMMEDAGRALVDKFDTLIDLTLPAFRKQFGLYLLQLEQAKSVQVAEAVDDVTNDAFRRNAELVGQNAEKIARSNQRSIVDIDTVKFAHDQLMQAVEAGNAVYLDGERRRQNEAGELSRLRQDFIAKVVATRTTH